MKSLNKIALLLVALVSSLGAAAQKDNGGLDSLMRSNNRIYVVVAVLVTILLGILFYVMRLDRKITKLEKDN
ncbi:MAG: CcmD family protein [Chitinophagaceae bacterium]|nr:CcmD family protein [Chitinophagaceae bacterium]